MNKAYQALFRSMAKRTFIALTEPKALCKYGKCTLLYIVMIRQDIFSANELRSHF